MLTEKLKVVILAGGLGARMAGETEIKPKPMVEIGGRPIMWHIMMHYATFGFNDFIIALGYKGEIIKRYMTDFITLSNDMTINMGTGEVQYDSRISQDWTVELVDTGLRSETGGRLRRLRDRIGGKTFMMAYGDSVSNLDLRELLAFHRSHGKLATITAVRPPARFGHLIFEGDRVARFSEKSQSDEGWIYGGFLVLEPEVIDFIDSDDTRWEREPLERLAAAGQLMAYQHYDFWQCMDTLRDRLLLEQLWDSGNPPWQVWEHQHAHSGHRS